MIDSVNRIVAARQAKNFAPAVKQIAKRLFGVELSDEAAMAVAREVAAKGVGYAASAVRKSLFG